MSEKPWRMILRGAFQEGWVNAPQEEKDEAFHYWIDLHKKWEDLGAELVGTLDDELGMTGLPGLRMWNFYEFWKLPNVELVKQLLDCYRYRERIRLDKYFRFEVVIGKPIGSVERKMGLMPPKQ